MKTFNDYFKYVILFTFALVSTACAEDDSTKLKSIIQNSINNQSPASDRLVVRKILNWPGSCDETFNAPTSGLKFFKQSDTLYITQVVCTYGSHQGMSVFYKLDLSGKNLIAHQLKFPVYNSNIKRTNESEVWGNVLTSSTFNKFTILNLYSGYGHCGSMTEYDISGEQPRVSQLKIQPDCEAKNKIREPEKWPIIQINDK